MITKTDSPDRHVRPEDSHAFSLEALRAREAQRVDASGAKASESGVIDLRALGLAGARADDLVTARLVATPAPTTRPTAKTPRWALATLGILGGAVLSLATMVAVGMPHRTATRDPAPRPTMAAAAYLEPVAPPANALDIEGAVIPDAAPAPPAPEPEVEPGPEPEPKAQARSKSKSKSKPKSKKRPASRTTSKPKPRAEAPKAATGSKPATPSSPSVACILDPASCDMGGKPTAKPKPTAPTSDLPEKLSASQIRNALRGPKAQAKQCADVHAAPAGTTVKVKLSIAGSGDVRSAKPLSPHADGLGRCVANALSEADFDRFSAPAMGVVYSVRL